MSSVPPFSNYTNDPFAQAVERALGVRIRRSKLTAANMWSALDNVNWQCDNGVIASYTLQDACALISSIRGDGTYLDWYCTDPHSAVSKEIEEAMRKEGWTWSK